MKLSENIIWLRERMGWNQFDLAKAAGIPQPTVSRLESGAIEQPKMATLVKIAKALGVAVDFLVADDAVQTRSLTTTIKPRRIIAD